MRNILQKAIRHILHFLATLFRQSPSLEAKVQRIQKLPVHEWSPAFLESKRNETDPVADNLIRYILENHDEDTVNTFFRTMVRNSDIAPETSPPVVQDYFSEGTALPSWADRELLAMGEGIYLRHGVFISLILSCKSLPQCYACAKGAMVLYHSGRLNDRAGAMDVYSRRIVETAQFVVDVMSSGGMAPGGKGVRAAQKVRLVHAAIRYFIRKQGWDATLYDEPINQEDMAGTLMAFSALVLDGLKLFHVQLSDAEEEAFFHCWRVAGHFIGVSEDLLPNNVADARALGNAIFNQQVAPSEQGKTLTAALIAFKEQVSPEGKLIGAVHEMLRYMMGDPLSDLLGVPQADPRVEEKLKKRLYEWTGVYETFEHRSHLFSKVAEAFSKIMLQGMLNYMNHQKKIYFYIPESLQQDWAIRQTAPN